MHAAINDQDIAEALIISILPRIMNAISIVKADKVIFDMTGIRHAFDEEVEGVRDDFPESTKKVVAGCFWRHAYCPFRGCNAGLLHASENSLISASD
jgi:hypothetical protein